MDLSIRRQEPQSAWYVRNATNVLIPKEARVPRPFGSLICGHGTQLDAVPPFYKPHLIKNIENGDFGNANQAVDAWAQSLMSFSVVPSFSVFTKQCSFGHAAYRFPVLSLIYLSDNLIFILLIKVCMGSIIQPPLADLKPIVEFYSYRP